MSKGALKCLGSPIFLKSQYGSDYNLALTVKKNSKTFIDKITKMVRINVKEANLSSKINREILYRLSASQTKNFPKLLNQLENFKEKLGILNVSISANSIEQVFLK